MSANATLRQCWATMIGGTLGLAIPALAQLPTQLRVDISPPVAVAEGAGWRLPGESAWRPSGVFQTDIPAGSYLLEYREIPGWISPTSDRAVSLGPESTVVVAVSYTQQPEYALQLSATAGGYLRGEDWGATGMNSISGPGPSESWRWESAVRRPGTFDFLMPPANAGWRVRIRAIPQPDFQFIGWTGDTQSTRNPITLIMNRPYALRAQFSRVLGSASAVQVADGYFAGGTLVVHGQFSYAQAQQLSELTWRPTLPAGWKLDAVTGLAGPVIEDGGIRFTGPLGHNPILVNMEIEVPAGEQGARSLGGEVRFAFAGDANLRIRPVDSLLGPGDLVLQARPSPAARLSLGQADGKPILHLTGTIGRTYTLEHLPEFFTGHDRFWWFVSDVVLTNSPQAWVDDTLFGRQPSSMYRAVLIE